jgi:hypothetical protein
MAEYRTSVQVVQQLVATIKYPYYALTIIHEPLYIPLGFVRELHAAAHLFNPLTQLHVVVCENILAKLLYEITAVQLRPQLQRFILVNSLAKAEETLHQRMLRDQNALDNI